MSLQEQVTIYPKRQRQNTIHQTLRARENANAYLMHACSYFEDREKKGSKRPKMGEDMLRLSN